MWIAEGIKFRKKKSDWAWKVIWEIESDWNRNLKRKKKKYLNFEKIKYKINCELLNELNFEKKKLDRAWKVIEIKKKKKNIWI